MNLGILILFITSIMNAVFPAKITHAPSPTPLPVAQKVLPPASFMLGQSATTNCTVSDSEYALDPTEQQFITLFNNFRAQKGLSQMKVSPNLTRAAAWMAKDMAQRGVLNHTDSLGRTFDRFVQCGYDLPGKGENIAEGYADAQSVLNAWIKSPEHYQNMIQPTFIVMGIARAQNPANGQWYWSHDFGGTDDSGSGTIPTITAGPVPTTPICTLGGNCKNTKVCCQTTAGQVAVCDTCDTGQTSSSGCSQGLVALQLCPAGNTCQSASCVTPPTPTAAIPTTVPTMTPVITNTSTPTITSTPPITSQPTSFITIAVTPPESTSTPTSTPLIPPSTLVQTQSFVTVVMQAPGIGNLPGDNPNPKTVQRNAIITVYKNDKKTLLTTASDTVTYDPQDGTYSNTITIPNLPSGSYFFSVKVDNSIPLFTSRFAQYLGENQTIQLPTIKMLLGDLNNDGVINVLDYNIFAKCYGNKICPDKTISDLNSDGKVEDIDLNILLRNFSLQEQ